jgi:hypothetical protein
MEEVMIMFSVVFSPRWTLGPRGKKINRVIWYRPGKLMTVWSILRLPLLPSLVVILTR